MTGNGVLQIAFYTVVLIVLAYPLGIFMARVYNAPLGSFGRLGAVERGFLRLLGSKPDDEQDWKGYGITALIFTGVFVVFLYLMLRIQGGLPLNPDDLPGVSAPIALNTAASFVTNTNWQYYGGEYTMSYLTQMAGLAVQNFVSAAAGMAVLAAVVRGFARALVARARTVLARPLPVARLPPAAAGRRAGAIVLISQGVPQTFDGHATAHTVEGATQTIARGPVASQIAIKQLGTNGGGFYNSNSAVPFENPNGLTTSSRCCAILLIPTARSSCSAGWSAHAPGERDPGRDGGADAGRRRDRLPDRAASTRGAARLRRQPRRRRQPERRQHVRQGDAVRHRQHERPLGRP